MPRTLAIPLLLAATVIPAAARAERPTYCGEAPEPAKPSSLGLPWKGRLKGARPFVPDTAARLLPRRHAKRCLNYATPRLVEAIERASRQVQARVPDSPPLGVGNLSRANGGPIRAYSKSHQSGRDADLAFFQLDEEGKPAPAEDLTRFGDDLRDPSGRRFDVTRNWALVSALVSDPSIEIRYLFVSRALRKALLEEGERQKASPELLEAAAKVLHQPRDSRPHDDHFHLRIACSPEEAKLGCSG